MFKSLALVAAVVVSLLSLSSVPQAHAAADYRVRANLNGTGLASGKAEYREKTRAGLTQQRFDIEVEDAMPGEEFEVMVNGQSYGVIIANDLGVAELQFRSGFAIDNPGDGDPIPGGFPRLIAGDVITVGSLTGTFAGR